MKSYNSGLLLCRRSLALLLGLAGFPVVCWSLTMRSMFYSFLYRFWRKQSSEPVWLTRCSEHSDLLL